MRSSNRRPNWWVLYAIVAFFIFLLFREVKLPLSETAHRSIEIAITLLFYGLVWMWLGVNDLSLMQEDMQRERQRKLRLLNANTTKPAPLADASVAEPLRGLGVMRMVLVWIIAIALAIYRFILP
jgi:energy-coupling factor transporter transmembrane protein EcfT